MILLFEFCNERKIESGTSELKLDFLYVQQQEKVETRLKYTWAGWERRKECGKQERNWTETVVTNIAIKLNIHRFQKKSKRAGKNIGLFRTFFVPIYIAHFKSYHDCNRLETFCRIYASLSCLIWIAISFDFATKFLKRRSKLCKIWRTIISIVADCLFPMLLLKEYSWQLKRLIFNNI